MNIDSMQTLNDMRGLLKDSSNSHLNACVHRDPRIILDTVAQFNDLHYHLTDLATNTVAAVS
jgi:hypothetical protein